MTSLKSKARIVVTGAAGFIGSNLCQRLLDQNHEVIGIDNFLTGREINIASYKNHPNFKFINQDLNTLDDNFLSGLGQVDYLFHFASPASPPKYQAHPIDTYLVNSYVTHRLLDHFKNQPDFRFIFASTSEVYGDPAEHPQKESYWGNVNPNGIRSCYDESKRMGETICGVFHRDFQVDTRIVRIFNTYGPKIDPNDGRVISSFIQSALKHEPLQVNGDGSQTRSYCYIDDLLDGILEMAAGDNLAGQTINIGNNQEITILNTAQIIWNIINRSSEIKIEHNSLPQDDPTRRQPDLTKAHELLGYKPRVSIESGLVQTIDYFRQEFYKV